MNITATELKRNLGHYLELSQREDVYVSKNGKLVSKLSSPFEANSQIVESLVGILPEDYDAEAALRARRGDI